MKKKGAIIQFILGIIFLFIGTYFFYSQVVFLKNAVTTTGTVVAITMDPVAHQPKQSSVRFTDAKGQQIIIQQYTPLYIDYVGQQVRVYYDPSNSVNAKEDTGFELWWFPGFFTILGIVLLFISISFLRLGKTSSPKTTT